MRASAAGICMQLPGCSASSCFAHQSLLLVLELIELPRRTLTHHSPPTTHHPPNTKKYTRDKPTTTTNNNAHPRLHHTTNQTTQLARKTTPLRHTVHRPTLTRATADGPWDPTLSRCSAGRIVRRARASSPAPFHHPLRATPSRLTSPSSSTTNFPSPTIGTLPSRALPVRLTTRHVMI